MTTLTATRPGRNEGTTPDQHVIDADAIELAAAFDRSAGRSSAAANDPGVPAGHRRRLVKHATQAAALARLFANSHRCGPVPQERRARWLADTPVPDHLRGLESRIERTRSLIVAVHAWRGHSGSVPDTATAPRTAPGPATATS